MISKKKRIEKVRKSSKMFPPTFRVSEAVLVVGPVSLEADLAVDALLEDGPAVGVTLRNEPASRRRLRIVEEGFDTISGSGDLAAVLSGTCWNGWRED
jgi:hypothetical protein